MEIFNSHIHTAASPDCKENIEDICRTAVDLGISGIAITDHFSGSLYISYNSYDTLKTSYNNAQRMASEYRNQLIVLKGVEFDEMHWCPEYINRVISSFDLDVVLASVHRAQHSKDNNYFSRIDFSAFTEGELSEFACAYFDNVYETVKTCDFDVFSHLTIILRYICGKHKRNLDISRHKAAIDLILKTLIDRDKALEVNTSEVTKIGLMPDKEILARYRELGGTKVTIGTDAHRKKNLLKGFDNAVSALRDTGFDGYYYYKNRQPIKVKF